MNILKDSKGLWCIELRSEEDFHYIEELIDHGKKEYSSRIYLTDTTFTKLCDQMNQAIMAEAFTKQWN